MYYDSHGNGYTQEQVDSRIRKAKQQKKDSLEGDYCEECGHNDRVLHMSHDISVQNAKNMRQTELCWSVKNLTLRCDVCHRKHDKL